MTQVWAAFGGAVYSAVLVVPLIVLYGALRALHLRRVNTAGVLLASLAARTLVHSATSTGRRDLRFRRLRRRETAAVTGTSWRVNDTARGSIRRPRRLDGT